MTREAEARIMAKLRAGQTVTREDHVATIDDLAELDAFKAGVTEAGRMTESLLTAIYRRQVQIGAATHGKPCLSPQGPTRPGGMAQPVAPQSPKAATGAL